MMERPAKALRVSAKERRVLDTVARRGEVDWSKAHANTVDALHRKGLLESRGGRAATATRAGRPGRRFVTPSGRAVLATIPNLFDDLFDQPREEDQPIMPKSQTVPTTKIQKAQKAKAALARLQTVSDLEIDDHPLLDEEQRKLCKVFRNAALREEAPFTMLSFAEIALRATGNDYAAVTDEGGQIAAQRDRLHRHAAILYAYEAVRSGPPIVAETAAERGTLKDLEILASHGLP